MSKRWVAETAVIQKDHPILVVVRDNAGENISKELNDHFTERGIKNHLGTWTIRISQDNPTYPTYPDLSATYG